MTWDSDRLPELVRAMAARPRHEALRGHVTEMLRAAFGATYEEITHEAYLLDGSGRIDTMWGATVIELKSTRQRLRPQQACRVMGKTASRPTVAGDSAPCPNPALSHNRR